MRKIAAFAFLAAISFIGGTAFASKPKGEIYCDAQKHLTVAHFYVHDLAQPLKISDLCHS